MQQKLESIIKEIDDLRGKNLSEEAREKYYELLARKVNLEEYLQDHDDEYIEKDRAFDKSKCPISAPFNDEWGTFEPSLKDSGDFLEPCKHEDCPDYSNCWATKYIEEPFWEDLRN